MRVVRPGGHILLVDIARGWYGGELARSHPGETDEDARRDCPRRDAARGWASITSISSPPRITARVENAVQTYGFIFGSKAIRYLREHNQSVIRWKFCIHFKVNLNKSSPNFRCSPVRSTREHLKFGNFPPLAE